MAGKKEDEGVKKDNKGDWVTKERREVKCRRQEREAEEMKKTRVRHHNISAPQAKTYAWSPFFYVYRPIKKRARHESNIQLVENVPKNDGSVKLKHASGHYKTDQATKIKIIGKKC